MKAQRGISPLIATLILILIAVVGGGMVYAVFSNQAKSLSSNADFQVQSASISKAGSVVVISVTVKNIGTVTLDKVDITVYATTPPDGLSIGSLEPGETEGVIKDDATAANYTTGKSYVIELSAKNAADETIATRSLTVTVNG